MSKQQITILIIGSLLLVASAAVWAVSFMSTEPVAAPPEAIACTMDALICPDGSGVGRTGPSCTFSACPSTGSLTGVYLSDAQGPRLAVAAPEGVGTGASYAVLLATTSIPLDAALIGTTVTLLGNFTEGSTFGATGMSGGTRDVHTPTPTSPAPSTASIKIGETKFIGGIKITVNKIVSDSRCPVDVECIWAGNMTANVTLRSDTDKEIVDIISQSAPHAFDSHQVTLVEALPAARSNIRISAQGYTLTFLVEPLAKTTPITPPVSGGTPPQASGTCHVGGCSSEICSDSPDMVSNCMYSPEYACYKSATCQRQATGKCGWTQTKELSMCIKENSATTQTPSPAIY